jgi:hypothetical protein
MLFVSQFSLSTSHLGGEYQVHKRKHKPICQDLLTVERPGQYETMSPDFHSELFLLQPEGSSLTLTWISKLSWLSYQLFIPIAIPASFSNLALSNDFSEIVFGIQFHLRNKSWAGDAAGIECLLSKREALSSNPTTALHKFSALTL